MIKYIISPIFLCVFIVLAQDPVDLQIRKNRSALDKVKSEIASLTTEIKRADIKSSSALDQIKSIDRELSLIGKAKRLLNNETNLLNIKIEDIHQKMEILQSKLSRMREQYQHRVVHLYKKGTINDLFLLLESGSINQSLVRLKYYKFFADQEKRLINSLKYDLEQIKLLENELDSHLVELEESLGEKNRQEKIYLFKKKEKKVLIDQLQWNRKNLENQLSAAETEYQKLYQIILALERQRLDSKSTGKPGRSVVLNSREFKKNKGKLLWPVEGKILHAYGKQRNLQLKTTINNTGIDIKANLGTKVQAVFTGIVTMITYLSGYGNTIIIDHGEGYYSVYSHLEDVLVESDQLVETGEIIGLVGDSGSLEGTKLHFALFSNQQTENPQNWLR